MTPMNGISGTTTAEDIAGTLVTTPLTVDVTKDHVVFNGYDAVGRQTSSVNNLGEVSEIVYNADGSVAQTIGYGTRPSSITDVITGSALTASELATMSATVGTKVAALPVPNLANNDHLTFNLYDAAGRQTYTINGLGEISKNTYNADGSVAQSTQLYNRLTGMGASPTTASLTALLQTQLPTFNTRWDRTITNTFDAAGRQTSMVDGVGNTTEYKYDALGRRNQVVDPMAAAIVAKDNLLSSTDDSRLAPNDGYYKDLRARLGVVTGGGTAAELTDADKVKLTGLYTDVSYYDQANRVTYTVDKMGYVTQYAYDALGNVSSTTRYVKPVTMPVDPSAATPAPAASAGLDQITQYQYDATGRQTQKTDGEGYLTKYFYNALGQLWHTQQAIDNSATKWVDTYSYFNAIGEETYTLSGELYLTKKDYNAFGQLVKQTVYDKPTTVPASGNPAPVAGDTTHIVSYDYDEVGRLKRETRQSTALASSQIFTDYSYDALGNKLTVVGSADSTLEKDRAVATAYAYDLAGRVTDVTEAYGTAEAYTVHVELDAFGNTAVRYDAWGKPEMRTTRFYYDANGRLVYEQNAQWISNQMFYNADGDLAIKFDAYVSADRIYADGVATMFTYNRDRQLIAQKNITANEYAIYNQTYDAAGNLTATTNGNYVALTTMNDAYEADGATVAITNYYKDWRQRIGVVYLSGVNKGQGKASVDLSGSDFDKIRAATSISSTYDRNSRIKTATDANGVTTAYTYDGMGNKLTATQAVGVSGQQRITSYDYDKDNRLIKVTDPMTFVSSFQYDVLGNQTRVTDVNGSIRLNTFDQLGRLIKTVYGSGLATPAATDLMTVNVYDRRGNIVLATQSWGNGTDPRTTTYSYDFRSRKTVVTDGEGFSTRIGYDLFGNQISITHGLYLVPVTDATYDASKAARAVNDFISYYDYDNIDRMIGMREGEHNYEAYGGPTNDRVFTEHTFAYDGRNNRIAETEPLGGPGGGGGISVYNSWAEPEYVTQGTTKYTYDAMNRLIRTDTPAGGRTSYVYDKAGDKIGEHDQQTPNSYSPGANSALTWADVAQNLYGDSSAATIQALQDGIRAAMGYLPNLADNPTLVGMPQTLTTMEPVAQYTARPSDTWVNVFTTVYGNQGATENGYAAAKLQEIFGDLYVGQVFTTQSLPDPLVFSRTYKVGLPYYVVTSTTWAALAVELYGSAVNNAVDGSAVEAVKRVFNQTFPGQGSKLVFAIPSITYQVRQGELGKVDKIALPIIKFDQQDYATDGYAYGRNMPFELVPVEHTLKDVTAPGVAISKIFEYDGNHNLTAEITPFGTHNPTGSYDPAASRTEHVYDAMGNAIQNKYGVIYGASGVTVMRTDGATYDANNRKTADIDGYGLAAATYAYDKLGNRIKVTDALGNVAHYYYNNVNKMVMSAEPPRSVNGVTGSVISTFRYDSAGNRTQEYTYMTPYPNALNDLGALPAATLATLEGVGTVNKPGIAAPTTDRVVNLAYDGSSQLVSRTDVDGTKTTTVYNGAGKPIEVTLFANTTAPRVQYYTYDSSGRVQQFTDVDSTQTTYQYNTANNLIRIKTVNLADIQNPERYTFYSYDLNNNRTSEVIQLGVGLSTTVLASTQTTYDLLGNVVRVTNGGSDGSGSGAVVHDSTYDYNNNRITSTEVNDPVSQTTRYGYDQLNNLTSKSDDAGTINYAYDKNNRQILETQPSTSLFTVAGGQQTTSPATRTTYDAAGRVTDVATGSLSPYSHSMTVSATATSLAIKVTMDPAEVTGGPIVNMAVQYRLAGTSTWLYYTDTYPVGVAGVYQTGNLALAQPGLYEINVWYGDSAGRAVTVEHQFVTTSQATSTFSGNSFVADFRSTRYYDCDNRLTGEWNGDSAVSTYAYDAVGNMVTKTEYQTRIDKDLRGVGVYEWVPPTGLAGEARVTTYDYDLAGRAMKVTLPATEVTTLGVSGTPPNLTNAHTLTVTSSNLGATGASTVGFKVTLTKAEDTAAASVHLGYRLAGSGAAYTDVVLLLLSSNATSSTYTLSPELSLPVGSYDFKASYLNARGDEVIIEQQPVSTSGGATQTLSNSGAKVIKNLTEGHTYNLYGDESSTTDRSGNVTYSYYDEQHRKTAMIDPMGYLVEWDYDAVGNQIAQRVYHEPQAAVPVVNVKPAGTGIYYLTRRYYDSASQLIREELPAIHILDPSNPGALGATPTTTWVRPATLFAYDTAGHQIEKTTGVRVLVDGTIDTSQANTQYRLYDAAGHVIAMVDGNRSLATLTYDSAGNMTSRTRYWGYVSSAVWANRAQGLQYVIDGLRGRDYTKNEVTTFTYDALHRVTSQTDLMGPAGGQDDLMQSFSYDAQGNRTRVVDEDGYVTQMAYDAKAHVTQSITPNGATTYFVYDVAGNMTDTYLIAGGTAAYAVAPEVSMDQSNQAKVTWTQPPGIVEGWVVYDTVSRADTNPTIGNVVYLSTSYASSTASSADPVAWLGTPASGTKLYYRVVTKDSNGNFAVTQEKSFVMPASMSSVAVVQSGADVVITTTFGSTLPVSPLPKLYYGLSGGLATVTPVSFALVVGTTSTYSATIKNYSAATMTAYRIDWTDAAGNNCRSAETSLVRPGSDPVGLTTTMAATAVAAGAYTVSLAATMPDAYAGKFIEVQANWKPATGTGGAYSMPASLSASGATTFDRIVMGSAAAPLTAGTYAITLRGFRADGTSVELGSFNMTLDASGMIVQTNAMATSWLPPASAGTDQIVVVASAPTTTKRTAEGRVVLDGYTGAADGTQTYLAYYGTRVPQTHTASLTGTIAANATLSASATTVLNAAEVSNINTDASKGTLGLHIAYAFVATGTAGASTSAVMTDVLMQAGAGGSYTASNFFAGESQGSYQFEIYYTDKQGQKVVVERQTQNFSGAANSSSSTGITTGTSLTVLGRETGSIARDVQGKLITVTPALYTGAVDLAPVRGGFTLGQSAATGTAVQLQTWSASPTGSNRVSISYNALNQKTASNEQGGQYVEFGLDANGNVVETRQYGSKFDANNKLNTKHTTTYTALDARGRTVAQFDAVVKAPDGTMQRPITRYTYNALDKVLTKRMPDTNADWVYRYNDQGMLISTEEPEKGATTKNYVDSLGRVTAIINPNGLFERTLKFYDTAGNLVQETDGEGVSTTYTYDRFNRMASKTDGRGVNTSDNWDYTTKYEYDNRDRLVKVIQAEGIQLANDTSEAYNTKRYNMGLGGTLDAATQQRLMDLYSTQYEYDGRNNRTATINASFNDQGKPSTLMVTQAQTYDAMGRIVDTALFKSGDNSNTATTGTITATVANGATTLTGSVSILDATVALLGSVTITLQPTSGRLAEPITMVLTKGASASGSTTYSIPSPGIKLDPALAGIYEVQLSYRALASSIAEGNSSRVVSSKPQRMVFDNSGDSTQDLAQINMIQVKDEVTSYDVFGNAVSDMQGKKVYGAFGRLLTSGDGVSYEYDQFGRVIRETTPEFTDDRYDEKRFMMKDVRRSYDDAGRLTRIEDWGRDNVSTMPTALLRSSTDYTYTVDGLRNTEVFKTYDGAGAATKLREMSYTYDNDRRLTKWVDAASKDARGNSATMSYKYDLDGNRTEAYVDSAWDPENKNTNNIAGFRYLDHTYTFDYARRLTGETNATTGTDGKVTTAVISSYTYDMANNRQSYSFGTAYLYDPATQQLSITNSTPTTVTYQFDANNRVTIGDSRLYDSDGNITGGNMQTLSYDVRGNVVDSRTTAFTRISSVGGAGDPVPAYTKQTTSENTSTYTLDNHASKTTVKVWDDFKTASGWAATVWSQDETTFKYDSYGRVRSTEKKNLLTSDADWHHTWYTLTTDGREISVGTDSSDGDGKSYTSYDSNKVRTTVRLTLSVKKKTFVADNEGHIISGIDATGEKTNTRKYLYANGNLLGEYGKDGDAYTARIDASAAAGKTDYSLVHDMGVQDINANFPGSNQNYIIRSGDTLQSIASQFYGNPSLWYVIADANGLTGAEQLKSGLAIKIPNTVQNGQITAENHVVYNESDITGSSLPTLTSWNRPTMTCAQFMVIVLTVVVAVAITVVSAGAASWVGGLLVGAGIGAAGVVAGAIVAGVVVAVAATAVWNPIKQELMQQVGLQTGGFSTLNFWTDVAMAGLTGAAAGIGAGIQVVQGTAALANMGTTGLRIAQGALNVASAALPAFLKDADHNGKPDGNWGRAGVAALVATPTSVLQMTGDMLGDKSRAAVNGMSGAQNAATQLQKAQDLAGTFHSLANLSRYVSPWVSVAVETKMSHQAAKPSDWIGAVSGTIGAMTGTLSAGASRERLGASIGEATLASLGERAVYAAAGAVAVSAVGSYIGHDIDSQYAIAQGVGHEIGSYLGGLPGDAVGYANSLRDEENARMADQGMAAGQGANESNAKAAYKRAHPYLEEEIQLAKLQELQDRNTLDYEQDKYAEAYKAGALAKKDQEWIGNSFGVAESSFGLPGQLQIKSREEIILHSMEVGDRYRAEQRAYAEQQARAQAAAFHNAWAEYSNKYGIQLGKKDDYLDGIVGVYQNPEAEAQIRTLAGSNEVARMNAWTSMLPAKQRENPLYGIGLLSAGLDTFVLQPILGAADIVQSAFYMGGEVGANLHSAMSTGDWSWKYGLQGQEAEFEPVSDAGQLAAAKGGAFENSMTHYATSAWEGYERFAYDPGGVIGKGVDYFGSGGFGRDLEAHPAFFRELAKGTVVVAVDAAIAKFAGTSTALAWAPRVNGIVSGLFGLEQHVLENNWLSDHPSESLLQGLGNAAIDGSLGYAFGKGAVGMTGAIKSIPTQGYMSGLKGWTKAAGTSELIRAAALTARTAINPSLTFDGLPQRILADAQSTLSLQTILAGTLATNAPGIGRSALTKEFAWFNSAVNKDISSTLGLDHAATAEDIGAYTAQVVGQDQTAGSAFRSFALGLGTMSSGFAHPLDNIALPALAGDLRAMPGISLPFMAVDILTALADRNTNAAAGAAAGLLMSGEEIRRAVNLVTARKVGPGTAGPGTAGKVNPEVLALADKIDGVTEHTSRVAQAIRAGDINTYVLGDQPFNDIVSKAGAQHPGDIGGMTSPSGSKIYIRGSLGEENFGHALAHEGSHALDRLAGIKQPLFVDEVKAFSHQRDFQIASGQKPEFQSIAEIEFHVMETYGVERPAQNGAAQNWAEHNHLTLDLRFPSEPIADFEKTIVNSLPGEDSSSARIRIGGGDGHFVWNREQIVAVDNLIHMNAREGFGLEADYSDLTPNHPRLKARGWGESAPIGPSLGGPFGRGGRLLMTPDEFGNAGGGGHPMGQDPFPRFPLDKLMRIRENRAQPFVYTYAKGADGGPLTMPAMKMLFGKESGYYGKSLQAIDGPISSGYLPSKTPGQPGTLWFNESHPSRLDVIHQLAHLSDDHAHGYNLQMNTKDNSYNGVHSRYQTVAAFELDRAVFQQKYNFWTARERAAINQSANAWQNYQYTLSNQFNWGQALSAPFSIVQ
ncbi:LysM peptidoglycan-binding domain-containing protein [Polaromonas sp. A23]|uniref:LysM peptidoglycan-binding domain-containing protein n=1 Tax=Polaromonas sp. A23 TaxID=1944133 RepID=UPI001C2CA39E|nr:LysM peptidoglycan-binding domain-containing protein [Polaromonas sp. A23]